MNIINAKSFKSIKKQNKINHNHTVATYGCKFSISFNEEKKLLLLS